MKKVILLLIFILGSILIAEPTEEEVNSFLKPGTQVYISNQKDWFFGESWEGDDYTSWDKLNFLILARKTGNKYMIAYTILEDVESYDKEKYPELKFGFEKFYNEKTSKKEEGIFSTCCNLSPFYGIFALGTEIKNGKKYERKDYQRISEDELNSLLKSKNAKRLDADTEKNVRRWIQQFIDLAP